MPFVTGSIAGAVFSSVPSGVSGAGTSVPDSSLTTLSRAGRLASGKSVGAEGDDGSSRGRFADGAVVAEVGDADMVCVLRFGLKGSCFKTVGSTVLLLETCSNDLMYTRKVERKLAGVGGSLVGDEEAMRAVGKARGAGRVEGKWCCDRAGIEGCCDKSQVLIRGMEVLDELDVEQKSS